MNERNDQNINGYGQPVIPQTPTKPINDFEPVRPVPVQSTPVQPNSSIQENQTFEQPVVAPVQSNPVVQENQTFEQPVVTPFQPEIPVQQPVVEPSFANAGTSIEPNPFPTVEPVAQPTTSLENNQSSLGRPEVTEEPKVVERPVETPQPTVQTPIEPVIQPQVSVEKTVNEIMDEPAKKSKKSRHNKNVDDDWEEKPKKKGHGLLIFILIIIILGLGGYIAYDKGLVQYVMNKINGTEPKVEEETTNEEPIQQTPIVVEESTLYFISADQKNSLMLGKEISGLKSFVLVLAQGEAYQNVTGSYEIKDGKVILTVNAGCLDATSNFTCTLPEGAEALNNGGIVTITLDYTDEKILLGNIELIKDNNQVNNEISSDTTDEANKNLTTE